MCDTPVYFLCEDFANDDAVEHRWRHVEHLVLECPRVLAAVENELGPLCIDVLRTDLLNAVRDNRAAILAVEAAFPVGGHETPGACVYSVPFLLDPAAAMRSTGRVSDTTCVCG